MIWQGEGLIIKTEKFSENSLIISLFSMEKGLFKTLVRGGQSKKKLAVFQAGNLISGIWKARLEEQLGVFLAENIVTNYNSKFLFSKQKNLILKTILELLNLTIKTGETYPELYQVTIDFFNNLINVNSLAAYINYELALLSNLGYGIDLTRCVVTGKVNGLYYVSPKTGNAVVKSIGDKYEDKLLKLPSFLSKVDNANRNDIENSFALTEYFLQNHILSPYHLKLPFTRLQLQKSFQEIC